MLLMVVVLVYAHVIIHFDLSIIALRHLMTSIELLQSCVVAQRMMLFMLDGGIVISLTTVV